VLPCAEGEDASGQHEDLGAAALGISPRIHHIPICAGEAGRSVSAWRFPHVLGTPQKTLAASDLQAGIYELRVKINDEVSKHTIEPSAVFGVE
jgi:hypothetical protein